MRTILPPQLLRIIKKIYLASRGFYYKGSNYQCPICNHKFRKMLPGGFDLEVTKRQNIIGSGLRNNNICPYCQSTDRDRLVFLYLKHQIKIASKKIKILHVSPEPSLYNYLKKLSNINYVTGTKYSEGIYYHNDIESIDLLDLPYSDGEFDLVICNHVLEHIIDDTKAMSEIYRVVTKGGSAILQVPISFKIEETYENDLIVSEKEREEHFGQFDHVRIYGADYKARLENVGFAVEAYFPKDDVNINYFALNTSEKLFVAHKK